MNYLIAVLLFLLISPSVYAVELPVIKEELDIPITTNWELLDITEYSNKRALGILTFDRMHRYTATTSKEVFEKDGWQIMLMVVDGLDPIYRRAIFRTMGFREMRLETINYFKKGLPNGTKVRQKVNNYDVPTGEGEYQFILNTKSGRELRTKMLIIPYPKGNKGRFVAIIATWITKEGRDICQKYVDIFTQKFPPQLYSSKLQNYEGHF